MKHRQEHQRQFEFVAGSVKGLDEVLQKLMPISRSPFPAGPLAPAEPVSAGFPSAESRATWKKKIEDVGLLQALNQSSGAISLHIPWDIPENVASIKALAAQHGLRFDAVNSNTFQDQKDQEHSYKFGSLQHVDKKVRQQAIEHNIEVIKQGVALGSESLTVWLADGSSFPVSSISPGLSEYPGKPERDLCGLPDNWKMFVEYKAFEPNFYSMSVGDWGQSLFVCVQAWGEGLYAG
jgi:L-rhamnose isomerase/sugar isomerase